MAHGSKRILVIEDERPMAEAVALNLREEGFEVTLAARGDEGLRRALTEPFHLVVLDLMLPGLDGREVCRRLRERSRVPILMLTARDSIEDRVRGLEGGADDYLTKPFSMLELIARVKAHLRREEAQAEAVQEEAYSAAGVALDVARHQVTRDGQPVDLRPREFELLRVLLANRGRVIPRDRLLELVWGDDDYLDSGTLDVHIRWLRLKLEDDPRRPRRILTLRGVGYKFAEA
ncbi:MAG: response regulator transcription factor [Armatimonadetes bacterium]|nr:response regulator transcription factor [Armatimonadota bacterium]